MCEIEVSRLPGCGMARASRSENVAERRPYLCGSRTGGIRLPAVRETARAEAVLRTAFQSTRATPVPETGTDLSPVAADGKSIQTGLRRAGRRWCDRRLPRLARNVPG